MPILHCRLAAPPSAALPRSPPIPHHCPDLIQVVQHVLGLFDYRLRVVARDIADFERVLRRRIMTLPGVGNVEANVLLTEERRPGPLG